METPIRFASYELDPVAGELRKAGVRVRLAGQPLNVLALLASRPGKVVTREELKQALWTEDTFVDFDDGLNTAIRRIRRALDDSATSPRFIETLPKRGYRFVGEIQSPTQGDDSAAPGTSDIRLGPWTRWTLGGAALVAAGLWALLAREPVAAPGPAMQPATILTALPGIERDPTFSPDGKRIAFAWDKDGQDFDIHVRQVSGGPLLSITKDFRGDDIAPAWSPDGEWIAFWRQDGERSGVYLASPLGGNERRLSRAYPEIDEGRSRWSTIQLSWSRGGLLAYPTPPFEDGVLPESHRSSGIAILSLDGQERQLTRGFDTHPTFSPDGRRVAFYRGGEVFSADIDEGESSINGPLFPRLPTIPSGLRWLPNGEGFVFARISGGVFVALLASREEGRRLMAGGARQPALSRDGTLLAFANQTVDYNIWRIDLENGVPRDARPRTRIFASTKSDNVPRLSWDAERIVFLSHRNQGRGHWYVANVDGSNQVEHPRTTLEALEGFGGSPRWSPDGRWIASDTSLRLTLTGSNGGKATLLTQGRGSGHTAAWSSDGRWIYYLSGEEIWRMPFDDGSAGEPELIVEEGGPPNLVGEDLYYLRGLGDNSRFSALWRASQDGTGITRVTPPLIDNRCWAVSDASVYFVDLASAEGSGKPWIKRFDVATEAITDVVAMHRAPSYVNCLEVARDESFLLYVVDDSNQQDLMIIEGLE